MKTPNFGEEFATCYAAAEFGGDAATRERRHAGVAALLKKADGALIEALVRLAFRTKQAPSVEDIGRIRKAMKGADDAFPSQGNDRELEVLSAAALAALFKADAEWASIAALAVATSAAAGSRQSNVPIDLVAAADATLVALSESTRQRPKLGRKNPFPAELFGKAVEKLKAQPNAEGMIAALQQITEACQTVFSQAADRLAEAAAFFDIQDEELEMLWWLMGDRSWDLSQPFGEVSLATKVLVLPKELADITAVVPGPKPVQALLARAGVRDTEQLTIASAVNACKLGWLGTLVSNLTPSPVTLPIHTAIQRRVETGEESAWIPGWAAITGFAPERPFPAIVLSTLFYRERLQVKRGPGSA